MRRFHYAHAARWTVQRAAAELQRMRTTPKPDGRVLRRWQDLHGRALSDATGAIAPVSLYLFASHQPADALELSVQHKRLERFIVRTKVALNLETPDGELLSNFIVEAETEATLNGLFVVPDNIVPKPDSAEKASKALEPFVDGEWSRER